MLHFGDDLVRLAVDIDSGHSDRRAGVKARTKATSRLLADLGRTRSAATAKAAKEAQALRKQLRATVAKQMATFHRDRLKSGTVLRRELNAGRERLTADVNVLRSGLAADALVVAEELRAGLADFVGQLRTETADLLDAVKEETTIARTGWKRDPPAKAPPRRSKSTAKARGRAAA